MHHAVQLLAVRADGMRRCLTLLSSILPSGASLRPRPQLEVRALLLVGGAGLACCDARPASGASVTMRRFFGLSKSSASNSSQGLVRNVWSWCRPTLTPPPNLQDWIICGWYNLHFKKAARTLAPPPPPATSLVEHQVQFTFQGDNQHTQVPVTPPPPSFHSLLLPIFQIPPCSCSETVQASAWHALGPFSTWMTAWPCSKAPSK